MKSTTVRPSGRRSGSRHRPDRRAATRGEGRRRHGGVCRRVLHPHHLRPGGQRVGGRRAGRPARRLTRLVPGESTTRTTTSSAEPRTSRRHERKNGQSHVTAMVLGATSHAIPISAGEPMLGQWQRLMLLELDDPKDRTIVFHVFGELRPRRGRSQPSVDWMQPCLPNAEGRARSGWGTSSRWRRPVRIQSMTTTKTSDVNATLQQIASLVATGVDIVRVAVPHWEDAEALKAIADKSTVPVIADIHFQWKYAMAALEAGIHGLRINPGNIKYHDKVRLIAREAKDRGVPIRIGVNAGSLEKDLLAKYGRPTPEALVESALNEARILEDEDFFDIKISVKHSNARGDDRGVPAAGREVRLPAAPRRDRGGADADGRREVRGGDRHAARRGHRRHDPRLAHRRPRRGGQGRNVDPPVARPARSRPRPGGLPVVRPGRGRRARPDPAGQRGAGEGGPEGADPRGRHGLRGERSRRGPRGGPRASPPARARASSSSGGRSGPRSPRTSSSRSWWPRPGRWPPRRSWSRPRPNRTSPIR